MNRNPIYCSVSIGRRKKHMFLRKTGHRWYFSEIFLTDHGKGKYTCASACPFSPNASAKVNANNPSTLTPTVFVSKIILTLRKGSASSIINISKISTNNICLSFLLRRKINLIQLGQVVINRIKNENWSVWQKIYGRYLARGNEKRDARLVIRHSCVQKTILCNGCNNSTRGWSIRKYIEKILKLVNLLRTMNRFVDEFRIIGN